MAELEALFEARFFGNTTGRWIVAGTIALAALIALLLLRRLIRSHYRRLLATPQTELMELPLRVASRTTGAFLLMAALFAGLQALELPARSARFALTVFTIAAFWQIGLWATTAVLASLDRKRSKTLTVDRAAASSLGIIGFIARATIWSFVLLLTLDNLGIEIKPLLAGLGIGGIAVALAAQNILGDLFASLSIALDKPFVVGDSLTVDEFTGTVEYIGVKSTHLRSVSGEQIIMTNANLLGSRIRNHARLSERRVVLNISAAPETSRAQLQKIPGMVRTLIQTQKDARFDRAHFTRIGPASLDFEVVYFVTTPDYTRHMDIQQDVQLGLIDAFDAESIRFAYPQHGVVIKTPAASGEGSPAST
ncbi:MAG TPA: mechanosensitive ion channel family protein [Steroidobacter sp.]|nr:mechanosensitive ion channel family protein [Steroidobacter sp.]